MYLLTLMVLDARIVSMGMGLRCSNYKMAKVSSTKSAAKLPPLKDTVVTLLCVLFAQDSM
jgi:hypothetical protein